MEEFYPSEIARLVLGYLDEMKWKKSWRTFLEESSDLQEYFNLFKKGKVYATNVNGKSLSDILSEYCDLKREALLNGSYQEQSSKNPSDQSSGVITDAVEKIVINAVDVAFQKFLPQLCKNRVKGSASEYRENETASEYRGNDTASEYRGNDTVLEYRRNDSVSEHRGDDTALECMANDEASEFQVNNPVSGCTVNDFGDNGVFIGNESKKNKVLEESILDDSETLKTKKLVIRLLNPGKIACSTLQPNITNVMSLTNKAYDSIDSSQEEFSTPSLLALKTVARMCYSKKGLSERFMNNLVSSSKKPQDSSSSKKSQDSPSRSKSPELPIVIKIEDDDDTVYTTKKGESNDYTRNAAVQREDCESRDSGVIDGVPRSETTSIEPDISLPYFNGNTPLSLEVKKSDVGSVAECKPNSEILNPNSSNIPVTQGNSTPVLDYKNLSLSNLSHVKIQNLVETSNSTSDVPGISINSNSIPNQLNAVTALSFPSVPTYIVSNFPSNNQIVQSSSPYQFIINTPGSGMPLTIPTIPANSVSNSVFNVNEPNKVYGTSQLVPISPCSNTETTTTAVTKTKILDLLAMKSKKIVIAQNKTKTLPEEKDKCSTNASKTPDSSSKRKSLPSKSSKKSKRLSVKKEKQVYSHPSKKRKLLSSNESCNLPKEDTGTSTEENEILETDNDIQNSPDDGDYVLFK